MTGSPDSNSAKLSLHCDNVGTTYISYDGSTWTNVGTVSMWTEAFIFDITDVTAQTVIRHKCVDHGGVGGSDMWISSLLL